MLNKLSFAAVAVLRRGEGTPPQTVEKPQESARGAQLSRISIVVGGVYGDHGADFA